MDMRNERDDKPILAIPPRDQRDEIYASPDGDEGETATEDSGAASFMDRFTAPPRASSADW